MIVFVQANPERERQGVTSTPALMLRVRQDCLLLRRRVELPNLFLVLLAVEVRNALRHPLRLRLALQVVLEELEHAHREVAGRGPVRAGCAARRCSSAGSTPCRAGAAPGSTRSPDTTAPRRPGRCEIMSSGVFTRSAMKTGEFSRYFIGASHSVAPMRLCVHSYWNCRGQSRAPADAVVGADHVRHRRAGDRGLEAVRLRHHVRDLVAAPRLPVDADRLLVHVALIDHCLNRRQHALDRALAGRSRPCRRCPASARGSRCWRRTSG